MSSTTGTSSTSTFSSRSYPPTSATSSSRSRQTRNTLPRQPSQRRPKNPPSHMHRMAPINAKNPAMIPIYNCIIALCCCIPGPGGRGVQVGLCPRISAEETSQGRRRREKREREENRRLERELAEGSSTTGVSVSLEGSRGGGRRSKGKGKEKIEIVGNGKRGTSRQEEGFLTVGSSSTWNSSTGSSMVGLGHLR